MAGHSGSALGTAGAFRTASGVSLFVVRWLDGTRWAQAVGVGKVERAWRQSGVRWALGAAVGGGPFRRR